MKFNFYRTSALSLSLSLSLSLLPTHACATDFSVHLDHTIVQERRRINFDNTFRAFQIIACSQISFLFFNWKSPMATATPYRLMTKMLTVGTKHIYYINRINNMKC